MSKSNTRYGWKLIILLIGAVAAIGWSWQTLAASQADAQAAADELSDCQKLADHVKAVRQQPQDAQSSAGANLNSKISAAAQVAKIDGNSGGKVIGTEFTLGQRIGDSDFQNNDANVPMRDVSMEQLFTFLHTLLTDDKGLEITSITLKPTEAHPDLERWDVDLVVSYRTYSPKPVTR